jgi:SAM-dependent methyltransferase
LGADFPRLLQAQYAFFDEDLPFWLSLAASSPGPILELGCGPGRVLSALLQAGFTADGLDHDPEMLRRAADSIPRQLHRRMRLIQGDLRRPSLDRDYGLILVPCNTFATLDESAASASLTYLRAHLLPGGLFAAEMPSPHDELAPHPDPSVPIDTFIEPETGHAVQVYADQRSEIGEELTRVTWRYDELRPDGTVVRREYPALIHLRTPEKLGEIAKRAGFDSSESFGDYDRHSYSVDSPRLLFVARA